MVYDMIPAGCYPCRNFQKLPDDFAAFIFYDGNMKKTKVKLNIWEIRHKKKMRAKDLAEATGISISALHYYESSQHSPTLDQVYDMAVALGVNFEDLFEVPEKTENNEKTDLG